MIVCKGCGSTEQLEGHHVIPRSMGGEDGPIMTLCATCHSRVHKIATSILKNTAIDVEPAIYNRLLPAAKAIVRAHNIRKENPEHFEDQTLHTLQFKVSPRQLARLHKLKAEMGFTSLDKFMDSLIRKVTRT